MTGSSENTRTAIIVGATVAFLIAIGNLYWQVAHIRGDVVSLRQSIVAELSKIKVTAPAATTSIDKNRVNGEIAKIEALRSKLESQLTDTRGEVTIAANRAKTEAVRHADRIVGRMGEEHQGQHKEVASEIGQVKQVAVANNNRIETVSADVASIKEQVTATRFELERTVGDLKRVTGDLGVQSGHIATNARELAALKMLGERNYFDFHLQRAKQPQRVGGVSVVLKKTDPKNNRYTLEVVSGEKRTEKRDRGINEPVQFYVTRSRMPYEIVVNEVDKDYVIGYLSAPKEQVTLHSTGGFK
ncbi:MAG: hypothetical protein ACRD8O_11220 [Bryobacteraceae bacterium]